MKQNERKRIWREWDKIRENIDLKGILKNDKSTIHLPRQHMSHPLKPLILQAILSSRDDFTKVLLKNVGISSTNLEVNKKSRTLLIVNYN